LKGLAQRPKQKEAPNPQGVPNAARGFDELPDSAYVRQPVIQALFSISASTVWRWVNSSPQRLPAPRKFGERHIAWNVGEIRKVLKGDGDEKIG